MPITLKTGAVKIKDASTGSYLDIDMSLNSDYALIHSPEFEGEPTAPTPSLDDSSTKLATTAFVKNLAGISTPLQDSSAGAVGSSLNYSREDHVHPTAFYKYREATGSFLTWCENQFPADQENTENGCFYVIFQTNNFTDWPVEELGTALVQRRNSHMYIIAHTSSNLLYTNLKNDSYPNWYGWKRVARHQDIPAGATADPLADSGSGSIGSSSKYAKEDHVHPLSTKYVRFLPESYTGATDINSVIAYALANGPINWTFSFTCHNAPGTAQGYFGNSSFTVICKFSSENYGYGIMVSDNFSSFATFLKSGSNIKVYSFAKKEWSSGSTDLNLSNLDGTVPVANGGTGQQSASDALNSFINALSVGNVAPSDSDYFIAQYTNGGETTKTYHRKPFSVLWNYIKSKISSDLNLVDFTKVKLTENSSIISDSNVFCVRYGRVVNILGWFIMRSAPTSNTDVFLTGLPAPAANVTAIGYDQSNFKQIPLYMSTGATTIVAGYANDPTYAECIGHYVNIAFTYISYL